MSGSYFRYPLYVFLWMVALMSGTFSLFRELYGMYLGTVPARSLFWSCTWIAFVVSAAILWAIEHKNRLETQNKLADRKPHLNLNIESAIWIYDKENNQTVFVLASYLVNKGEPTIAMSWGAKYQFGDKVENMTGFYLRDIYQITIGNDQLTLTNDNLLPPQVITNRLERGEGKLGRLLFTVPNNRLDEIATKKWDIKVQCFDFEGTPCLAVYRPTETPLPNTLMFPGEKLTKNLPAKPPQAPA
jgi:hypothetical protein